MRCLTARVRNYRMLYATVFTVVFALHLHGAFAERATVLLVTGRKVAPIGGGESVYNLTREASISTQVRLLHLVHS